MKICCPVCGSDFPLLAGLNDADARRFAVLMGELPPPIARLMPGYLQLFKPVKRGLRWSRLLALTQEIAADILSARVERHGRSWPAPQAAWIQALQAVIDKRDLALPLKGHGLLREILAAQANKTEAQIETKTEEQKRQRPHRDAGSPEPIAKAIDRDKALAHVAGLKGVVKP